jgi:dnd system-associated protein 4
MALEYPDIRRPLHHEGHMQNLIGELGPFETMRDALVFCAALGFSKGRREEFAPHANSIAWGTMAGNQYFEQILLLLTAAVSKDVPEQLGDDAIRDRVKTFEEFACGGLSIVAEEMRRSNLAEEAVLNIISARVANLDSGAFSPFGGEAQPFNPFA